MLDFTPRIPIPEKVEYITEKIQDTFAFLFDPIKNGGNDSLEWLAEGLAGIPAILVILIVVILAFFVSGKRFGLAAFSLVGLWLIYNQGLWEEMMLTFALVLISSILSVIIGVPIGILMSKSKTAQNIITPVLDFMQTMPAFVYLIPAVAFFSIGMVAGVFSSLIFATPPTVRLTNLGIRQVSRELIEASEAFGSTGSQKLFKVELPMAKNTIMAGINQTVMLSLSMVVIASMIGAPGLGREVLSTVLVKIG
ncbi:ABC transporter permease [Neobacillus jeddahensis]|uniref:ABC transporter permease n=1 Tax=Neobacillus jeddahensis TaxID=1461580 RepID=UPI0009DEB18D|nr:ABC transporter permease subunit [Neobacillus jeddahensis]